MRTFVLLFASFLAACGTSSSNTKDDGGTDSSGGCINATEGDSCTSGELACSSGNACCDGFLQCVSGHWVKEYPGCECQASTFTCGTQTCSTGQICKTQESGVDGGTSSSSCASAPAECATDPSCACIADSGVCAPTPIASCTDVQGHLVIDCMGQ